MLRILFNTLRRKLSKRDRFELVVRLAGLIYPDYRFKWPQLDWWADPDFSSYLEKFDGQRSKNADRRWMIYQLMRLTSCVDGDTAECGSYVGAGSFIILKMGQHLDAENGMRRHFIFDSFEGLSEPGESDGEHWSVGDLAASEQTLRANLGDFGYTVYPGWIPTQFSKVESKRFSFVHIDVDLEEPTRQSLEFFYPRMNQGGIILFDDYGFSTCPGATETIDDFLANKEEAVISLSGGGGFIIKGIGVKSRQSFGEVVGATSKK